MCTFYKFYICAVVGIIIELRFYYWIFLKLNRLVRYSIITILGNAADTKTLRRLPKGHCTGAPPVKLLLPRFLNTTTHASSIFLFRSNLRLYWTGWCSLSIFLLPTLSLFISFYALCLHSLILNTLSFPLYPFLSTWIYIYIYFFSVYVRLSL